MYLYNNSAQAFVLNLDSIQKAAFDGEELVAPLQWSPLANKRVPEPGALVVVLAGGMQVVAHGFVRNWCSDQFETTEPTWLQCSLQWLVEPQPLEDTLISALEQALVASGQSSTAFHSAVCVSDVPQNVFHAAWPYGRCQPQTLIRYTPEWYAVQRAVLLERDDLHPGEILSLLQVLEGSGPMMEWVRLRDTRRWRSIAVDADDCLPCPIVPWDVACDDVRMDPENYVLLNSGGVQNFLRGLLRVEDDGNLAMAPAMSCEVAFSFGMDWNLRLPTPSERQRRYLAYHRQHIFGQWNWPHQSLPAFEDAAAEVEHTD